jgi:hypothetical protein
VLPISAPFNLMDALKIQYYSCKLFVASKNIAATPSQGLALRYVVLVIIRRTWDIKFLQRFPDTGICASNYYSTLNRYAFIFRDEIIFLFSVCLSSGLAQTCRLAGNLEPLLQCGERSHEVNRCHRLYGAQQAIDNEEGAGSCEFLQPSRSEARPQAACVRHGAQRGADSAITVSEQLKSVKLVTVRLPLRFR